jgi:hypothetical protein
MLVDVYKDNNKPITPSCLGVTRGDHVPWPNMDTMIPTMMIINMSTDGNPSAPLIHLYNYRSTKSHHIQETSYMGHGKRASP